MKITKAMVAAAAKEIWQAVREGEWEAHKKWQAPYLRIARKALNAAIAAQQS